MKRPRMRREITNPKLLTIRAWAVHVYTSLGLPFALLAALEILRGNAQMAFVYLGVCNAIDSTDGTLARAWKVNIWASQFDGRKLDDIIDYITYAFLPLLLAYRFGLIGGTAGLVTAFVVLIAAVYGFCQKVAKTVDGYFTGFPNYWNFVVFYLYLLKTPQWANTLILLILAALVFVPIKYLTFSSKVLRPLTTVVASLYGGVLIVMVVLFDKLPLFWILASLVFPAYYFGISIYLYFKGITDHSSEGKAD